MASRLKYIHKCISNLYVLNGEKQAALLVYSSLKRLVTSSLRRTFAATSSVSQRHSGSAQIRSENGVTPYSVQHRCTAE